MATRSIGDATAQGSGHLPEHLALTWPAAVHPPNSLVLRHAWVSAGHPSVHVLYARAARRQVPGPPGLLWRLCGVGRHLARHAVCDCAHVLLDDLEEILD